MTEVQKFHLFGGKGGVGKTTLATAFAINLLERNPKEKVLLVSAEPARSLSDLLKKKLSTKPVKLLSGKGTGGLFAAENEPGRDRDALWSAVEPALAQVVAKGSVVAEADLSKIYGLCAPGIGEFAALSGLLDLLEAKTYDRIVVDFPSTSQALHVLDLPAVLRRIVVLVRAGDKAAEKAGSKERRAPESAKALDEFSARIDRVADALRDTSHTAFHLVALAEPVPEAQTRMLFAQLRERSVPIAQIVVNQVEDRTGCSTCLGRRGLQAPHVRRFQGLDKSVPVHLVGKREVAPRGFEGEKKLAKEWGGDKETRPLEFAAAEGPPALVRAPSMPPIAAPPLPPTRLIFFVGHGGVGKSSCAAAAAVTLTEKEGPVLLISADPAHSLSEVLQSRLTDTETQVKGTKGLYARELDTPAWLASLKKRIKEKADRAFDAQVKRGEVPYDREVLRNLLDFAPLGIEELASLSVLTDALVQERFKRIVVDTPPAADVLRLVEFPEIARGWLTALWEILVKYRSKGLGDLADDVATMLKQVKRFEEALASPSEARFVVVTRGEELAIQKTERLVEYLAAKKLAVERVLVNRVLPKTVCPKCENRRKLELGAAKVAEKRVGLPVTVAPALGRHPAGLRELKAFRTAWYALSATAKIKAA